MSAQQEAMNRRKFILAVVPAALGAAALACTPKLTFEDPTTTVGPKPEATSTVAPTIAASKDIESPAAVKPEAVTALDSMPSVRIEDAQEGVWFHRVFNPSLFNEANGWGGADSWFVSLNLGANKGGDWKSMGNPGQIVYRGTENHLVWTLGVKTSEEYKSQFMGDSNLPAAVNVRIAPNSEVTVVTADGETVKQNTSDMGDITIIVPENGEISISVDYTTGAPTHESLVWWGPYDRSENINTVDARNK